MTAKFTPDRAKIAYAIAILADVIQLPVNAATLSGVLAIPAESVDIAIDFIVMFLLSTVLGFHWMFIPSFFVEAIPGVDLLPTWTGCVALVVKQRMKDAEPQVIPPTA